MLKGIDELKVELDAGCNRRQAGFSLCIAKILQGLRKFRNHSENFTIPAKFSLSLRNFHYAHFFAKLAKFRYHSESDCA